MEKDRGSWQFSGSRSPGRSRVGKRTKRMWESDRGQKNYGVGRQGGKRGQSGQSLYQIIKFAPAFAQLVP